MSKKKRGLFVITSGTSLCGRKEIFLPGFKDYCHKNKKNIKIVNVGSDLLPWLWRHTRAKIPKDNILNVDPLALKILEAAVFQQIKYNLKKWLNEHDAVVLNLHTVFEWRNVSLPSANTLFLRELKSIGIEPDFIFCFIDNAKNILDRLNVSKQWSDQGFSESKIWEWQNHEVDNTENYLYLFDAEKKFFVMPVMQPPETMYYLLFEPWRPIVYAQMPISHATVKDLKKVVRPFIENVRRWAVVFDPLTIETGVVELDKSDDTEVKVRNNQTAHRDVNWFIPQVDVCLAYYFKVVFTAGVVDESVISSQRGKETWVIFPKDCSPFLPYRATRPIFKGTDEFLEFFGKEFIPFWSEKWKKEHKK